LNLNIQKEDAEKFPQNAVVEVRVALMRKLISNDIEQGI